MRPAAIVLWVTLLASAAHADSDRLPVQAGSKSSVEATVGQPEVTGIGAEGAGPWDVSGAPAYHLNWWSANGGATTKVNGTNFGLGLSTGQSVSGSVSGTNYRLGMGYWYGAVGGACLIALPGDVNVSGLISASDIIVLVNWVFKAGPDPLPCLANGDVNCNAAVSSSDIIYLVNKVFRAGPEPCDVCSLIPGVWSCP